MTIEHILEKWQPAPGSQLAQWGADIAALEAEIDALVALMAQRKVEREEAMGRLAAITPHTEPAAIAADRASVAAIGELLPIILQGLHQTRQQRERTVAQIRSADDALSATSASVESAKAEAAKTPRLESWVAVEAALHEKKVKQFLCTVPSGASVKA